jgi:hypothetical protein
MAIAWWLDRTRTRATLVVYQAQIQELEAHATALTEERQILKRQLWQATNK